MNITTLWKEKIVIYYQFFAVVTVWLVDKNHPAQYVNEKRRYDERKRILITLPFILNLYTTSCEFSLRQPTLHTQWPIWWINIFIHRRAFRSDGHLFFPFLWSDPWRNNFLWNFFSAFDSIHEFVFYEFFSWLGRRTYQNVYWCLSNACFVIRWEEIYLVSPSPPSFFWLISPTL